MNRLFGTKKAPPPKASLNEVIEKTDSRADSVDAKVKKLDLELAKLKEQLGRLKEGPTKNAVKQRALNILKQRKQYEHQRDMLVQQSFNMEQANMTVESLQTTAASVQAMKEANKVLKQQFKTIKVQDIEKAQDEMADLILDAEELQEVMSRSYGVPDEVDEAELEAGE